MNARKQAFVADSKPSLHLPGGTLRRFHLINVSPPKTGTKSIAGIFRQFRACHEFQHESATQAIHEFQNGRLDRNGLQAYLLARDVAGQLEVDSASFNIWYADLCVALFPRARFLLVVREPLAWLESALGHIRRDVMDAASAGVPYPARFRRPLELALGRFEPDVFLSPESLAPALPRMSRGLLRHWAWQYTRLLEIVPADRRLVLRTDSLSRSLPRLAAFAGVDVSRLDEGTAHLHARPDNASVLDLCDRSVLLQAIGREPFDVWASLRALVEPDPPAG